MANNESVNKTSESPKSQRMTDITPSNSDNRKERKPNANVENKPTRWVQIRMIPIWLRFLIVIVLLLAAVMVGVTIGYSSIGDGDSADALKWSTWQHLLKIIKGE